MCVVNFSYYPKADSVFGVDFALGQTEKWAFWSAGYDYVQHLWSAWAGMWRRWKLRPNHFRQPGFESFV